MKQKPHFSLTVTDLNSLFNSMIQQTNLVFWITAPEYQQQLYVSNQYESIWQRPCSHLYEHPGSWSDTLIPEDKEQTLTHVYQRIKDDSIDNQVVFRIHRPNGEYRWILDRSFILYGNDGLPQIIAGTAEDVTERLSNNVDPAWFQAHLSIEENFSQLLQSVLSASRGNQNKHRESQQATACVMPKGYWRLYFKDQWILLTKRESQCLEALLAGKTAKQTARELSLSPRTVELYLNRIREKVDCHHKLDLVSKIVNKKILVSIS